MTRHAVRGGVFAIVCTALTLAQTAVPDGFADEVFASGFAYPIAIAFLPDGRMLCAERLGGVAVVKSDGAWASTGTIANVTTDQERGLQGIAVDPQWPARPYLYAYYTTTSPARVQLSMFTMTGDLANPASTNLVLGTEHEILPGIPDTTSYHQGGTIAFGPDGKLYVFVGDDDQGCPAQSHGSPLGKVLRLEVSALPPAGGSLPPTSAITPLGNPYSGPAPRGPLVWASGLRNPFRAEIDPVSGYLVIADVGDVTWEEVDLCAAGGANFGWPAFEGQAAHPNSCGPAPQNTVFPFAQHHHLSGTYALVTLAVYRNPPAPAPYAFGPAYEGNFFYTDHFDGKIRRFDSSGLPAAPVAGQPDAESWAHTPYMNVTDGAVGPDGALYYTQIYIGKIRRIRGGAAPGPHFGPTMPEGSVFTARVGTSVSFPVSAIAPPGAAGSVTLSVTGTPGNAVFSPALPLSGQSPQSTFSWTPGFLDTGPQTMTFTAVDQNGVTRTGTVTVYVTDSVLVLSAAEIPGVTIQPGQETILVDLDAAIFIDVATEQLPVFGLPNDPALAGLNVYAQVARYNPAHSPTDPLKLSNGVHIYLDDEFVAYGPGSGLVLSGLPPYRPLLGALTTMVVVEL